VQNVNGQQQASASASQSPAPQPQVQHNDAHTDDENLPF
jgi:hypothetical protein